MPPLAAHRLGRFGWPRRRLRAGLVQLQCAVAVFGLGLLLPRITTHATVASTRVTDMLVAVGFGGLGAGDRHLLAAFLATHRVASSASSAGAMSLAVVG